MPQQEFIDLIAPAPGVSYRVGVQRYGTPGHGPKAYIQAALHADEVPALLVAQRLASRLAALEAQGQIAGEIVLVPSANPIGLAQRLLGQHQGRFDIRDGVNFNRAFAELGPLVVERLRERLGTDEARNVATARAALVQAAQALPATTPVQDLKRRLLALAIDADLVLDLHCDGEAEMHLYALSAQQSLATELGALLGARAVLLADDSGDSPFDEACSRPWLALRERLRPSLPLACFAVTVELRGEADTDHRLAEQDAHAIVEFLRRRGVIAGAPAPLPAPLCEPTPLAGSEPIEAPSAGVVVYRAALGAQVQAGQPIADVVDVASGAVTTLAARSAGLLYARGATRWAAPGQRLAKIAGTALVRTGKLLSP